MPKVLVAAEEELVHKKGCCAACRCCVCCCCGCCGHPCTRLRGFGWTALLAMLISNFLSVLSISANNLVPDPLGIHAESLFSQFIYYIQTFQSISIVDLIRLQCQLSKPISWVLYWYLLENSLFVFMSTVLSFLTMILFLINGLPASDAVTTFFALISGIFSLITTALLIYAAWKMRAQMDDYPTESPLHSSHQRVLLVISLVVMSIGCLLVTLSTFSSNWAVVSYDNVVIHRYGVRPTQTIGKFWHTAVEMCMYFSFPGSIIVVRDIVFMIVRNKGNDLDSIGETLLIRSWACAAICSVLTFEAFMVFAFNYKLLGKGMQIVKLCFAFYFDVFGCVSILVVTVVLTYMNFSYRVNYKLAANQECPV